MQLRSIKTLISLQPIHLSWCIGYSFVNSFGLISRALQNAISSSPDIFLIASFLLLSYNQITGYWHTQVQMKGDILWN